MEKDGPQGSEGHRWLESWVGGFDRSGASQSGKPVLDENNTVNGWVSIRPGFAKPVRKGLP
jgi:hypothetical protein